MLDVKKHTAEELMLIYQNNHPEEAYVAFEEIYFRYKKRVYSYLASKLKNTNNINEDCEDLMQKIFLKFHDKKHLYSSQYKLEQWLFVIARTQLLDFFRASKKEKTRNEAFIDQASWQNQLASNENELDVLGELSIDQKEFLEMKIIDELSYLEMSEKLNKSETSLRKNFSRLIQRIRKGEAL